MAPLCFTLYGSPVFSNPRGSSQGGSYSEARDLRRRSGEAVLATAHAPREAAAEQESMDEAHEHFAAARGCLRPLGVARHVAVRRFLLRLGEGGADKRRGAVDHARQGFRIAGAGNTSSAPRLVYLAEALRRLAPGGGA